MKGESVVIARSELETQLEEEVKECLSGLSQAIGQLDEYQG